MQNSIAIEITELYHEGIKFPKLKGYLVAVTAAACEAKLNEEYNAGDPNLLFDLLNMETISSARLSVLLSSNKRIRKRAPKWLF